MFENLFWSAVGWLAGYLTPGSFWEHKLVRDWQARRMQRALRRILEGAHNRVAVGAHTIDAVAAVQVFDPPLGIDEVSCTYSAHAAQLPTDLQWLESNYAPGRVAALKTSGHTVDFNQTYGLRAVRIERPQIRGTRRNRPELRFEPSNFSSYLGINEILDEPLLSPGSGPTTVRERHLEGTRIFEWSKLESIPIHMWFATVTAVVTVDNQLVVAIRSGMQSITDRSAGSRPGWRAALSCAEGMLRPTDSRTPMPQEEPSPFCTVLRGLKDELGLEKGRHISEPDIRLLGLGFDTQRYQPVGTFLVQLNIGFMDIYSCWQTAKDRQENQTLIPVSVTSQSLGSLMTGRFEYEGRPLYLFSNHQQLGVFLVASHLLGAPAVASSLKHDA